VQELAGNKWSGTAEKYIKVKSKNERELINLYFPSVKKNNILFFNVSFFVPLNVQLEVQLK
jgi:hypothetical protein